MRRRQRVRQPRERAREERVVELRRQCDRRRVARHEHDEHGGLLRFGAARVGEAEQREQVVVPELVAEPMRQPSPAAATASAPSAWPTSCWQ
ncbi:MAG: hypothetical protein IPJ77_13435 [Planctomycetes bacterium]|nr:hypothetical protein [Planctomycetota bacterium]